MEDKISSVSCSGLPHAGLSRQFGIEAINIAEHAPDEDIHRRAEGFEIFLNDISHSGLTGGM